MSARSVRPTTTFYESFPTTKVGTLWIRDRSVVLAVNIRLLGTPRGSVSFDKWLCYAEAFAVLLDYYQDGNIAFNHFRDFASHFAIEANRNVEWKIEGKQIDAWFQGIDPDVTPEPA